MEHIDEWADGEPHVTTMQDLLAGYDAVCANIKELKLQRTQLDEWLAEAVMDRMNIVREIEAMGGEIDFG